MQDGILAAVHCFEGLKRPLLDAEGKKDKKDVGKEVLVYSWRPAVDYVWSGSKFDGNPVAKTPPPKRVFVVLVRKESQPNHYPKAGMVFGSIERWNWVKEDPVLPHSPVDWQERYERKLWSRSV